MKRLNKITEVRVEEVHEVEEKNIFIEYIFTTLMVELN